MRSRVSYCPFYVCKYLISRRFRRPLYQVLALLVATAQASGSVVPEHFSPQGTSLQGTTLPGPGLKGSRFLATLKDRTPVEIVRWAGDEIHAVVDDREAGFYEIVVLQPSDLIGMQWTEVHCDPQPCTRFTFRIADAAPDTTMNSMARHPDNGDVGLYRIHYTSELDPGPGDWEPVCDPESGDTDMGMFVDGQWRPDGSWVATGYTFSCPRGVVSKCARSWGYKPWTSLESPFDGRVDMQPLHLACTRAARAEYCGDGVSYTRDGIVIDMFDRYGFNRREDSDHFQLESEFTRDRAVRVYHLRVPDLAPTCQGDLPGDEPALIYVASDPGQTTREM